VRPTKSGSPPSISPASLNSGTTCSNTTLAYCHGRSSSSCATNVLGHRSTPSGGLGACAIHLHRRGLPGCVPDTDGTRRPALPLLAAQLFTGGLLLVFINLSLVLVATY
jgi:hypothetical protein